MKTIVLSIALSLVAVSGCTAEMDSSPVASADSELRIVNGPFTLRSPGRFELASTQGATVPVAGCNVFTSLVLENAPLAQATLRTEVGPNQSGQICAIAAVVDTRVYAFNHAIVDDCGVKSYRGQPLDRTGQWKSILVLDRRANTCPVTAIFPPLADIEVFEPKTDGTEAHRFSRLPVFPSIQGSWGADQTTMVVNGNTASLRFGCASASIDSFSLQADGTFTGTGTFLAGFGTQPPPGLEPKPQPATYRGEVHGIQLTLDMTVDGNTSTLAFDKDRNVHLFLCQ